MKKYLLYSVIICFCLSTTFAIKNCRVVDALRDEIETYQRNERGFIDMVEHWRTCDSLDCARVDELTLSLNDALKVIGEDKKLIESLNLKIKNMEQVGKVTTSTQFKVIERLKDTTFIKQRDTIFRDTTYIKYIEVEKPYYDIHAQIVHDTISLDVVTRDSLLIVETVEYKRFLGFLWKTKKIKRRSFDVVSKNPNTIIEDFKVVTIRQ